MEFEDEGIGRFEGKESIGGMLTRQAPTIKLELSNIKCENENASGDFSDGEKPEIRIGRFKLIANGNKISRLIVTDENV